MMSRQNNKPIVSLRIPFAVQMEGLHSGPMSPLDDVMLSAGSPARRISEFYMIVSDFDGTVAPHRVQGEDAPGRKEGVSLEYRLNNLNEAAAYFRMLAGGLPGLESHILLASGRTVLEILPAVSSLNQESRGDPSWGFCIGENGNQIAISKELPLAEQAVHAGGTLGYQVIDRPSYHLLVRQTIDFGAVREMLHAAVVNCGEPPEFQSSLLRWDHLGLNQLCLELFEDAGSVSGGGSAISEAILRADIGERVFDKLSQFNRRGAYDTLRCLLLSFDRFASVVVKTDHLAFIDEIHKASPCYPGLSVLRTGGGVDIIADGVSKRRALEDLRRILSSIRQTIPTEFVYHGNDANDVEALTWVVEQGGVGVFVGGQERAESLGLSGRSGLLCSSQLSSAGLLEVGEDVCARLRDLKMPQSIDRK